jgi:hypothetical protein
MAPDPSALVIVSGSAWTGARRALGAVEASRRTRRGTIVIAPISLTPIRNSRVVVAGSNRASVAI